MEKSSFLAVLGFCAVVLFPVSSALAEEITIPDAGFDAHVLDAGSDLVDRAARHPHEDEQQGHSYSDGEDADQAPDLPLQYIRYRQRHLSVSSSSLITFVPRGASNLNASGGTPEGFSVISLIVREISLPESGFIIVISRG